MQKLSGKVALVTGATSGIGEATAYALASEGAVVAISGRRMDRLEKVSMNIVDLGGQAISICGDVQNEADAARMVEQAYSHSNHLDILINNAGVMLLGPILDATTEDWRRMVNTNLLGLMYTTHAALKYMVKMEQGHIVNISSTAGRTVRATAGVYNATKWGVGAFSEALRQEVHGKNIRVTIIEPGIVETELREHITDETTKKAINKMADGMRQLKSEDIANSIIYALTQPDHVNVNEILIRPTDQLA